MNNEATIKLSRVQVLAVAMLILGAIGSFAAFSQNRTMFTRAYLYGYVVWFGLTMGCLALMLLHHSIRANWSKPVLRLVEAGAGQVLAVAVMAIPIVFLWRAELFPWSNPQTATGFAQKAWYLNDTGFIVRMAVYFTVLWLFSAPVRRWSLAQDQSRDWSLSDKRVNVASPGILVFFLVMTFAITDLVMSLDPSWYSTIFAVIFIVGQGLSALALAIVMAYMLRRSRPFSEAISEDTFHDLGKMLLTLVMFWGYTAISQFLIMWAGNLPEEVVFYTQRMSGSFWYLGTALVALQFALPFVALLSARTKQKPHWLLLVTVLLIAMRLVDLFWLVIPFFGGADTQIANYAWMCASASALLGGFWLLLYTNAIRSHRMLPNHEPVGIEGMKEAADHV